MSLNPNTSTREEYTRGLTTVPLPPKSTPAWLSMVTRLRTLLNKLAQHPAMAPNLQQTYMTPAADKNNVYFMWDFIGRTLGMCYQLDPELSNHRPGQPLPEGYVDVISRCAMARELMLDSKPGMLSSMTEMTYPEQAGKHPEFGAEILGLARDLMEGIE